MILLKCLLIGQCYSLTTAPFSLLKRAGFDVDLVAFFKINAQRSSFKKVYQINSVEEMTELLGKLLSESSYDLIVIGDDQTLINIASSDLPEHLKLQALPVASINGTRHLYSKVCLSEIFQKSRITTPSYSVAANQIELIGLAQNIEYPIMLKIDRSGGGSGVFRCDSLEDVYAHRESYVYPLLIQKFIDGDVLDISAFYQHGQLVHFDYSRFEKTIGSKYGPSSVRTYWQLAVVDKAVFEELRNIGTALDAHGFMNISAVYCKKQDKRYYFEADMRPNVWVDFGRNIGNDAAISLQNYFSNGERISYPCPPNRKYPDTLLIPYIPRLSFYDLAVNRYSCWQFVSGFKQVLQLILTRFNWFLVRLFARFIEPLISDQVCFRIKVAHKKTVDAILYIVRNI